MKTPILPRSGLLFFPYLGRMTIQEAYNYTVDLIRQDETGYFSGDQFVQSFNVEQLGHFQFLIGKLTDRRPHDPVAAVNDSDTVDIDNSLSPFEQYKSISLTNGIGQLPVMGVERWGPPRMVNTSAYNHKCGDGKIVSKDARYPVEWLTKTEWATRSTSRLDSPKPDNAFWTFHTGGAIKVMPQTITLIEISYHVKPGNITFDDPSQALRWGDADCRIICNHIVKAAGIHFDAPDLTNFGVNTIRTEA